MTNNCNHFCVLLADLPRKALIPPASRQQPLSSNTASESVQPGSAPAELSALAPPAHVQLQEKSSNGSEFAYDYMLAVENNGGDVSMQGDGQNQQERKMSLSSVAGGASVNSHVSSECCRLSASSSLSESDAFSKQLSASEESLDSDDLANTYDLSSASLKKIVGSFDFDSDGELSGMRWPLQRDPPDGQEEAKSTADSDGLLKKSAGLNGGPDDVEVDHLYMNFRSGRLPQGGESDEDSS